MPERVPHLARLRPVAPEGMRQRGEYAGLLAHFAESVHIGDLRNAHLQYLADFVVVPAEVVLLLFAGILDHPQQRLRILVGNHRVVALRLVAAFGERLHLRERSAPAGIAVVPEEIPV